MSDTLVAVKCFHHLSLDELLVFYRELETRKFLERLDKVFDLEDIESYRNIMGRCGETYDSYSN